MLRLLQSYSCHDADACRIDEAMVILKVECSGKLCQYVVIDVADLAVATDHDRSREMTKVGANRRPCMHAIIAKVVVTKD